MIPQDRLVELAERVEQATGPDQELDALIGRGLGKQPTGLTAVRFPHDPNTEAYARFTSSLDAAMSLAKGLERFGGARGMLREAMDRLWTAALLPEGVRSIASMEPDAYREALARFFTAACLRALASQKGEG